MGTNEATNMLRTATLVSCISTLLLVLPSAHGHGVLNWPPSRVVLQNHHNDAHAGLKHGGRCLNHTCAWWGGMGSLTTNQTIPDQYRTVTSADPLAPGMIYIHPAGPWMSPGTASSKIAGMGDAICGIRDNCQPRWRIPLQPLSVGFAHRRHAVL